MRFEVPQFIDIEDKIFGPLSFKQFIYIAGGGGISFAIYKLLPIIFAIPLIVIVAGLAWAFAFYKFNNQPFINIGQAFVSYISKDKLYVWRKETPKPKKLQPVQPKKQESAIPVTKPVNRERIQNIARNLDILDKSRYN